MVCDGRPCATSANPRSKSFDDSPSHVYHDVLIALDESRGINNGQPSLWAYLFDRLDLVPGEQVLHLGCGTGYYTAIIAELVRLSRACDRSAVQAARLFRNRHSTSPWQACWHLTRLRN